MPRYLHRFVARLVIALLLYMQMAVAAHACNGMAAGAGGSDVPAPAGVHAHHAVHEGTACASAEQPADAPAPAPSKLCLQHCQQDSQVSDNGGPLAIPAVALPALVVTTFDEPRLGLACIGQRELLARQTAPPASIRFCVLRT